MAAGIYVFVDKTLLSEATFVSPAQMGEHWGQDNNDGLNKSHLVDWDIAATAGTLYVDNLYWDSSEHEDETLGSTQEMGARMHAFNLTTTEQGGPVAAGVANWEFFE